MKRDKVKRAKKRRFSLSRLFKNNNFVLILSLVIAIVVWIIMSLSDTNEATSTVTNIPIQIALSDEAVDNGLEIFSGNDQKASVTVQGNRVALGSISSDDITVSAQTAGTISTSGTYPLSLSARKTNASDNFEIISTVSPSVITIFVDHLREADFRIENKLTYNVADGYHAAVSLSDDSITVKGPQTEVSKIASVRIEDEVKGDLEDNTSLECKVKLYDNSGSELTSSMLTLSKETVTANFSVLPEKDLPIKVAYKNKPEGLNVDSFVTIDPNKILVAAPKNVLNKLESIPTEEIDFTKLNNKEKTFKLALDMPANCTDLSDTEKVDVNIDLSSYKTRRIRVDKSSFSVNGLDSGYSYSFSTDSLNVVIKGAKSQLDRLTASNIECTIDASDIDGTTGSINLPVKITLKDTNSCWVYGDYTANIYVTKT